MDLNISSPSSSSSSYAGRALAGWRCLAAVAALLTACAMPPTASNNSKTNDPFGSSWDSSNSNNSSPPDMLQPVPIGTTPPSTPPPPASNKVGCHGLAGCYAICNAQATAATYPQCEALCLSQASAAAVQQFNATVACGVNACISAGQCSNPNDSSDQCLNCNYDAISSLFGLPCSGDPLCNTSACSSQVNSCNASLP